MLNLSNKSANTNHLGNPTEEISTTSLPGGKTSFFPTLSNFPPSSSTTNLSTCNTNCPQLSVIASRVTGVQKFTWYFLGQVITLPSGVTV